MEKTCRILSIQSHVVRGYAGNRSAVFPLQILGFEVDFINSVQFSNHTGYPHWKGPVLSCDDIDILYQTLKKNNVIHYDYVLTGYCFDKSMLEKLVEIINELKQRNPNLIYVCDPVMGDIRENDVRDMYVPKDLLPVFKEMILPIADILTPNQFELEMLTDERIKCEKDVLRCVDMIHAKGPKKIVITSVNFPAVDGELNAYTSEIKGANCLRGKMPIPKIGKDFVGTGDLFAALLLAWTHKHPDDMSLAMRKVVSTMQSVLKRTQKAAEAEAGNGKSPTFSQLELRLVQSKKDIENPRLCVDFFEVA